ncbi:MAG: SEC-C metal-binding domain-containing protein [Elusimicrobiota bacterium]|nr:SEC-C metal-binding domain-containing protein [Elusimicrobiota bacterium]
MAWDFLKRIVGGRQEEKKAPEFQIPMPVHKAEAPAAPAAEKPAPAPKAPAAPVKEKAPSEKTDDELAAELDKMSPQILAQAKDPRMRALIISIYRKMLIDGVNINDDKEVKKWMKKHPEVMQGGESVKVETMRREEPKVGRNEPCACGSGKKYKKCCGAKA